MRYIGATTTASLLLLLTDKLLGGLCELLESIQESSGVVRVREAWLAEMERAFGAKSKEVGMALYDLGRAYDDLGDAAHAARRSRRVLERALPIYEREHGKDHGTTRWPARVE